MSFLKEWLDPLKGYDHFTDFLHNVTGIPTEDQKRNAAKLVNDQINAYKKQSQIAQDLVNQRRQEQLISKRRLDEKMVSAARGRMGGGGAADSFLGGVGTADFPDKLGV